MEQDRGGSGRKELPAASDRTLPKEHGSMRGDAEPSSGPSDRQVRGEGESRRRLGEWVGVTQRKRLLDHDDAFNTLLQSASKQACEKLPAWTGLAIARAKGSTASEPPCVAGDHDLRSEFAAVPRRRRTGCGLSAPPTRADEQGRPERETHRVSGSANPPDPTSVSTGLVYNPSSPDLNLAVTRTAALLSHARMEQLASASEEDSSVTAVLKALQAAKESCSYDLSHIDHKPVLEPEREPAASLQGACALRGPASGANAWPSTSLSMPQDEGGMLPYKKRLRKVQPASAMTAWHPRGTSRLRSPPSEDLDRSGTLPAADDAVATSDPDHSESQGRGAECATARGQGERHEDPRITEVVRLVLKYEREGLNGALLLSQLSQLLRLGPADESTISCSPSGEGAPTPPEPPAAAMSVHGAAVSLAPSGLHTPTSSPTRVQPQQVMIAGTQQQRSAMRCHGAPRDANAALPLLSLPLPTTHKRCRQTGGKAGGDVQPTAVGDGGTGRKRAMRPLELLLTKGLLSQGEILHYRTPHGEVKLHGTIVGTKILCHSCHQLIGCTEFEKCAGSALRRPTHYICNAQGQSLQEMLDMARS